MYSLGPIELMEPGADAPSQPAGLIRTTAHLFRDNSHSLDAGPFCAGSVAVLRLLTALPARTHQRPVETKRAAPKDRPLLPRSIWRHAPGYEVFLSCATSASRILRYSPS